MFKSALHVASSLRRNGQIWLALALLPALIACSAAPTPVALPVQIEIRRAARSEQPGLVLLDSPDHEPIFVDPTPAISNADLARVEIETMDGRSMLKLTLTPEGAQKMAALSRANIDQPLALMVDGELLSAPIIQAEMSDQATIPLSDNAVARRLAQALGAQLVAATPVPPPGRFRPVAFADTLAFDIARIVSGLALAICAVLWYRDRRSTWKRALMIGTALLLILLNGLALFT